MARRRSGRDSGELVFGSIGWLFADLMFALAMAFLVATTVGRPADPKQPPPASPSPSPSFKKGLESRPVKIVVSVDAGGLLSGDRSARSALQRKVRENARLRGRQAGLVLAFGGTADQGPEIARKATDALRELGDQGFVFHDTLYKAYHDTNAGTDRLTLDIYLLRE